MKLLLDEMFSPEIARQLRAKGHEVEAVTGDRPDLQALDDEWIVEQMAVERRGIVTNNVKDFMPIHNAHLAAGKDHYGMVFSVDKRMPRGRATIGRWVKALDGLLADRQAEDALKNAIHYLSWEPS